MHRDPWRAARARGRLLTLAFASLWAGGCGNETIECDDVDLVRSEPSGLCVARCAVQPSDPGYRPCPSGYSCGVMGCFMICGMQSCSTREMCDPSTMTCVRRADGGPASDAGTSDASEALDAGLDAGLDAITSPERDVGTDARGEVDSGSDAAPSSGDTCSLGLPSSGTQTILGGARGALTGLRIAAGGGRVVWADATGIQVVVEGSTTPTSIARAQVQDIAISPTHLYWAEGAFSGAIYRLPWDQLTTMTPELLASPRLPAFAISVSASALYYATDDGATVLVYRTQLDGTMARLRGSDALRRGERATDLAVAGDFVFVSLHSISGLTGCFRVLRWDAAEPMEPELPPAVAIYGPTSGSCSATTFGGLAVEGSSVFFHSSAPPEIVEYDPVRGVRRIAPGFGDGSDLGLTPPCVVAGARGLVGVPRSGAPGMAYPMGEEMIGRLAVDGVYAYGFVPVGSTFRVVRVGL